MRILNRTQFLAMPAGTFFFEATERWAFGPLSVKWDTLGTDFVVSTFDTVEAGGEQEWHERMGAMVYDGASFPLDLSAGRDGVFERDALYLIMDKSDIQKIRDVIDRAILAAPEIGHE